MINALPVLTSVPMLNHAEQKLFSVTKVVDSSGKKKKKEEGEEATGILYKIKP